MTMRTETVTKAYLPGGADDLGDLVAVTHEVATDGVETLRSVLRGSTSSYRLPKDFHATHDEVATERLLAMRSRFRATHVLATPDDTRPGDPDHLPPIPSVTNGAREGSGVAVAFERDAIEGPSPTSCARATTSP